MWAFDGSKRVAIAGADWSPTPADPRPPHVVQGAARCHAGTWREGRQVGWY